MIIVLLIRNDNAKNDGVINVMLIMVITMTKVNVLTLTKLIATGMMIIIIISID